METKSKKAEHIRQPRKVKVENMKKDDEGDVVAQDRLSTQRTSSKEEYKAKVDHCDCVCAYSTPLFR